MFHLISGVCCLNSGVGLVKYHTFVYGIQQVLHPFSHVFSRAPLQPSTDTNCWCSFLPFNERYNECLLQEFSPNNATDHHLMPPLSWRMWPQYEKQRFLTPDEMVPSGSADMMMNEMSEKARVRHFKPWQTVRTHLGFGSVSETEGV